MQTQPSLDEATDRFEHNAVFIGVLPALLIGAVLLLVQPLVGVVVALVLSIGWVLMVRSRLAAATVSAVGALPSSPLVVGAHPRLDNVLEGLCATSGVTDPAVSLVESSSINALVAADRETTSIVLTTGLVDDLDRLELEGVLANLLARVKDGSARYTTTVLALLGSSSLAIRMIDGRLGDQRSVRSDLAAVDLTRYPPGLIAAFVKMSEHGTMVDSASGASVPLWLAPPVAPAASGTDQEADGDAPSGQQPLSLRIAVLSEL